MTARMFFDSEIVDVFLQSLDLGVWIFRLRPLGWCAVRLLDRYLLRELLVPLGYCLSGFFLLWVAGDLIADLGQFQSEKLHGLDIAQYYLVRAPEFLVLVLPVGLLLALLYTLTNHARHNEITAIRAAGVSLWRICLPYLTVGLLASLALFALNELFVPDSADRAEQIRKRYTGAVDQNKVLKQGFDNARAGRSWYFGVYNLKSSEMLNSVVISTLRDGSRLYQYADRAVYANGVWTFYNVRERKENPTNSLAAIVLRQTNVLARPDFSETPDQIKSEIRISNSDSLLRAKKADLPIYVILNYLHLHPHPAQAAALYTKLQGRLALPWTCLVVVLIATPFGAGSGRRNVFVGVASSILIFFVYYVLQQLCLHLGAGGYVPAWVAGWFPNLAFGLTGLWLTTRVR
jgi:lipopolysaccharide export system permease protein